MLVALRASRNQRLKGAENFERHLYLARKEIEWRLDDAGITDCYIPSFSSRNILFSDRTIKSKLAPQPSPSTIISIVIVSGFFP